jgi:hypothetical protein
MLVWLAEACALILTNTGRARDAFTTIPLRQYELECSIILVAMRLQFVLLAAVAFVPSLIAQVTPEQPRAGFPGAIESICQKLRSYGMEEAGITV